MYNLKSSRFNCVSAISLPVLCVLFVILLEKVPSLEAHIGQPCALFDLCWPPNIHIYCDVDKICRCRPETPVIVGPHQCKRNKSHGDKCSSDQECIYSDNYSFCESNLCNCIANYTYDPYLMKCMHFSISQRSSFNVLYTMLSSAALWFILLFIGLLISIPCCLAFLYHCVCYEKSNGEMDSSICQDTNTQMRLAENGANTLNREGRESTRNMRNGIEGGGSGDAARISSRHNELSSHKSYEMSCFDEPPPSYDEACKQCRPAPNLSNQQQHNTSLPDGSSK